MELPPSSKFHIQQKTPKTFLLIILTLILLPTIFLNYHKYYFMLLSNNSASKNTINKHEVRNSNISSQEKQCDMFKGDWVPSFEAPKYTNSCFVIHDAQNCHKYGKPNEDYLMWKWKPYGCDVPVFEPTKFFEIVRGKSLAFVGDSVGRNQMESLICLLSTVEDPMDVSTSKDEWRFKRFWFPTYNFTIAIFWSPLLVKVEEANPNGTQHTGLLNLYLEEFDEKWTTQIEHFNYVVISAGHWFFRPIAYYEDRQIIGSLWSSVPHVTNLPSHFGYRKAFRTAFKAINSVENYKGITFLRTFAPSHFDGDWEQGATCLMTRPFKDNETSLVGHNLEFYNAQIEEFKVAKREGEKRGLKFRLIDVTRAMLLRPDAHPSKYGHWQSLTARSDCVHWCLPGPIDIWNDLFLEMLKMEKE